MDKKENNRQEIILLKKIDDLRKVLNLQIQNKQNFEQIIETSKKIDKLINRYYMCMLN